MDHLVELCREGRIAGVGMGAKPDHVRAALGEPDDESVHRDPHVLVYGAIELALVGGVVELIMFGFGRPFGDVPPALADGVPRAWSDLDRTGVLAALRARGVDLTPHPHPVEGVRDYRAATVLGDVVNVTFEGDRLAGVACARGERSAPRILFMPAPRQSGRA